MGNRYVLDGNALALTATEANRRRRAVDFDFNQPDTIIVSVGYPELMPDTPYSRSRSYDLQIPACANCTATKFPSNADNFITFLDSVLRPWIRNTLFPASKFSRDGLYGHSLAGLFALYVLLVRPDMYDTLLSASPSLWWENGYISIFSQLQNRPSTHARNATSKPAIQISYGALEQFPIRRRLETDEEWARRETHNANTKTEDYCKQLYHLLKRSDVVRDVELHKYPFSDHPAVAAAAFADGLDYFYDWPPRIAGD